MSKHLIIALSISTLIITSCRTTEETQQNSDSTSNTSYYSEEDLNELDPCQLLTEDMVKSSSQSASNSDVKETSIFGCTYDWDDNRIELIYTSGYAPQTEEEVDNSYRSMTNFLTEQEESQADQALQEQINQSEELAQSNQNSTNSILENIKSNSETKFQSVSAIGDRSAWDPSTNRLVVQHHNFIFTVKADQGSDNKQVAENLAPQIITNIDSQI